MQATHTSGTQGRNTSPERRVVITGIGLISPLGNEPQRCFERIGSSASAITALPQDVAKLLGVSIAGIVPDFDPEPVVGKKNIKRTARFLQMALACARSARTDARLSEAGYDSDQIGCLFGSAFGGLDMISDAASGFMRDGLRGVSPYVLPGALNNMAAGMAAIDAGANGPCYSVSAGWTSSLIGLGHAYHAIRHGAAEAMITGGAESLVDSPLTTGLLKRSGMFVESSEDPAAAMRPFDATRRGAVATEGAVMLVLETLDAARRRGVVPYAEVVGFASRYEPTATQRRCGWHSVMASCMQDALEQAGVSPEQIGYVNAYGSAQARTDAMETLAVKQVFGAASRDLWLSSTKGAAGHMLGASGSFEVAMTALSMKTGVVLPTANLRMRDPECDLDYMAGPARERRVEFALKNTFAETGHCGTVVLRSAA